jgi:hypothetical protein
VLCQGLGTKDGNHLKEQSRYQFELEQYNQTNTIEVLLLNLLEVWHLHYLFWLGLVPQNKYNPTTKNILIK